MNFAVYGRYDSYKDSGFQWIGEIPQHWDVRRFRFLCSIGTGERNTEDKQEDGQYPFFVRSQTPERISSYAYDGEAILTAGDGAGVGKVYHYINGKFDFHQRVYKFSDFREVDGKYLFYYLSVNFASVALLGTAKSTVDSLRLPLIQDFPVAFPKSEAAQIQIVAFLDGKCETIDEAVRIKEEQIRLLAERRQILIRQAVTRGLNADAPMKDSGIDWIGQIPAHWEVRRFKYLFEQSRLPVRPEDEVVTSFRDGQVTLRSNRRLEGYTEAIIEGGYQGIRVGQLVLNSMDAFEGAIGVSESDGKCTPEYVICDPILVGLRQYYFAYLLREMALARYIQVICNAVRQRAVRIRFNNLAHRFLVVPPPEEQEQIVHFIEQTKERIGNAISIKRDQIAALQEYKTSLINAAVSGKIKVI